MFMIAPEDIVSTEAVTAADEELKAALEKYPVGGVILFSKNIETREQTVSLIRDMQELSQTPMFIGVDEEGGRVSRLGGADVGVTKFPPMGEIGAGGDPSKAFEVGETLGRELRQMGFNVDFAPVADTIIVSDNEDISDRSFGTDPNIVAEKVAAEGSGMESQNLCATLKHFPGNGSTVTNTHEAEGICSRTLEEMRATEFIPFKAGIDAGADMVMVAHMTVPDIVGDTTPSTLSPIIITDLLRGELGFEKVVVTDALSMGAITSKYSPFEAAIGAINAGADVLLMSPQAASVAEEIVQAVESGEISESRIDESVRRILSLKQEREILN